MGRGVGFLPEQNTVLTALRRSLKLKGSALLQSMVIKAKVREPKH